MSQCSVASDARRLAVVGFLAVIVCACGPKLDEETRIEQTITGMIDAVEQGDVSDFMAPVADDFVADNRPLDRRALRLLVRRERMAREAINIQRLDTTIEVFASDVGQARASASFRVLATGGSGLLPDEGRFWTVETGWRRDGDDWMLISAKWE